ncbi:hypothetical protein ECG_02010 [Echinococcus granulosus]|uniref:CENP-X domain containing protein n=2 Tax=Echinococcus TaxID=6209 RepID=A0A068WBQ7_ECHGR|nr:hypothetical protein ECG_02010 [Echinococcus granulosus]CDS15037.1 CENP-X domain containing protein [Echinococcus granulosus]CDS39889.1 hypothetical protein EmuJ_000743900 [Echinococcus multilocularis]
MDKISPALLRSLLVEQKTKFSKKATHLSVELLQLYINAFERIVALAKKSGRKEARLEDFESILIQLTLDFAA